MTGAHGSLAEAVRVRFTRSSASAAARAMDWFRHSAIGGPAKEWQHFSIVGETVDLIVNLSVSRDEGRRAGRAVVLARADGRWSGTAELVGDEELDVRHARIHAVIGHAGVCFERGRYHLTAVLRDADVELDLWLTPLTLPAPVHDFDLEGGAPLHWLVMPRLGVEGRVRVAGREHDLGCALAYHDHNWGSFSWGAGLSWEWAFGLPRDPRVPWTVVFARLGDRARTKALSQTLFVWQNEHLVRVFHADEVEVEQRSFLAHRRVRRVPGVLGLLVPGACADVPAELTVRASGDGDRLELSLRNLDYAQVLVPNDAEDGLTVINEVASSISCHGEIRREALSFEGRANLEVVGGA